MSFDKNRMTLSGKKKNKRGKKLKLDMEEIYRLVDKENKTVAQLCEMFQCSRSTLQRYHREYQAGNPKTTRRYLTGYSSINRCRQYKYINVERLLEQIDSGKTIAQICREYPISRTTLRNKFLAYRKEELEKLQYEKGHPEENGDDD